MVDNMNPTNQFHPYQAPDAKPNAEKTASGLGSINWETPVTKVRDYMRSNPGVALGAIAALAIGAGLMRRK